MASRYHSNFSSRSGNYVSDYSHLTSDAYRSHTRAQSEQPSRINYTRAPFYDDRGKPRSHTLSAFVEDEHTSLAKEHNPHAKDVSAATKDGILSPGAIDQVPILIEVDENPERRFVLVPGAATATKASGGQSSPGSRTPTAPAVHPGDSSHSPNASTGSDATPRSPASTPPTSADGVRSNGHAQADGGDSYSGYEANTCRKFVVVPHTGADSVASGPSTIATEADNTAEHRRRAPQPAAPEPRTKNDAYTLSTAAELAAAAAAAKTASSKPEPDLRHHRSRVDLPRTPQSPSPEPRTNNGAYTLSTAAELAAAAAAAKAASSKPEPDLRHHRSRADLPRIDTDTDQRGTAPNSGRPQTATYPERRPHERARSDRTGDKTDRRDNDFLSPAFTMHSTNGRDRAYFDQSNASPSREESVKSHISRVSPSPQPSSRQPTSSSSRTDKRPPSPPRTRDWDWEREKDKERDWDRDRDRERDRDRTAGDRYRTARRDSVHRKRRDSFAREDDVYLSDDRAKTTTSATANTPIRRRNSERRRPANRESEAVSGKASSNVSAGSDSYTNGRPKPIGAKPLAVPSGSQSQYTFTSGSSPKPPLFDPRPPSPTKSYREERRTKDDRRPRSPSPPSSSPESRSRIPEGDRPRGPRPRAHGPNVVHNPASASISLPNLPPPTTPARTATVPVPNPIPIPIPIPMSAPVSMPIRATASVREEAEGSSYERRSPIEPSRAARSSFASSSPARASGFLANPPRETQPPLPHRQPAFYVNIPGAGLPDDAHDRLPDRLPERLPERPAERPVSERPVPERPANNGSDSGRVDLPLASIFLKYAEDVYQGRAFGYPECPRRTFSTRPTRYRVLAPFADFYVCTACYEAAFAPTRYRNEFVPAPPIDPEEKTRCTFGSMYWYRVAFFFIEAYQKSNLNLLRAMFEKDETLRLPCSGPNRVMGRWFTIQDPITAHPITQFSTCEQCATAVQILFPSLKGLFQDNDTSRFDTTNICALYFEPDRKRLWKYIDVFETTHNEAVLANRPVDVNKFVNKLLDIGYFDECLRDTPVRGRKWYWMRSVPDFVVCQECFTEAVLPEVNSYRTVAGDFFKEPKELPLASCHLYSPRMREIFLIACKNNDKEFLAMKLRQRDEVAKDISDRIERLLPTTTTYDPEHKALIAEWRKWE